MKCRILSYGKTILRAFNGKLITLLPKVFMTTAIGNGAITNFSLKSWIEFFSFSFLGESSFDSEEVNLPNRLSTGRKLISKTLRHLILIDITSFSFVSSSLAASELKNSRRTKIFFWDFFQRELCQWKIAREWIN